MVTSDQSSTKGPKHHEDLESNNVDSQPSSDEKKSMTDSPGGPVEMEEVLDTSLPRNWSTKKKFYNMAVPAILCLVV